MQKAIYGAFGDVVKHRTRSSVVVGGGSSTEASAMLPFRVHWQSRYWVSSCEDWINTSPFKSLELLGTALSFCVRCAFFFSCWYVFLPPVGQLWSDWHCTCAVCSLCNENSKRNCGRVPLLASVVKLVAYTQHERAMAGRVAGTSRNWHVRMGLGVYF
jgi:hypothetical protein